MLLNPKNYQTTCTDPVFRSLVEKTIEFFENKGLSRIKQDDQSMVWYEDFLDFIKEGQVFATLLTPASYGGNDHNYRWDMRRICEYNEVLGFYGLCYWYAWQVTILGLGPIWMGQNEELKHRTAQLLKQGGVFAFGLSEKNHGADLYSSEMTLEKNPAGGYLANGSKYYIGNGNCAVLVSTFGKYKDSGEYVFFTAEPDQPQYDCVKKIDTSGVRQAYVAEYRLNDYPVKDEDIISTGEHAWNSSLNTINIGKFELGCASVGICTHAFYEALNHASARRLYGRSVTDFPHVRRLFVESYVRLAAMKMFAWRTVDYLQVASDDDRRYLLFNPVVKMKVTGQGEQVIDMLHEIIAAKGYEQDTYFEMAIRDIGMLPKLEGTEHVNMALIIKFVKNYFFSPVDYPEIGRRSEPSDETYLFQQKTGGLATIRFPDYERAYQHFTSENVTLFKKQVDLLREMLVATPPDQEQVKNVDYMLAAGELFTLVVYAQLILEAAQLEGQQPTLVEAIFSCLVTDFSRASLNMVLSYELSEDQEARYKAMIQKPAQQQETFNDLWREVILPLQDEYTMNP
ncbi:MAG: acyl-CoA dehydrogenase [Desulfobulbaceae bacterium]|nr:MAG: acyl-CoA dehydrogenase [Desulfobulbaceae bacterium]